MTSTLILYKDTRLTPERNFIVEDISDYLLTISTKLTISDFQFQRHQLEMEIKVDLSQSYQEYQTTYNYNYCSIQDGVTGKIVYYFIVNKRQIAQSTMAFQLLMDTANTLKWNTDYIPTSRTKVIREHKDRLKKSDFKSFKIESSFSGTLRFASDQVFNLVDSNSVSISCISNDDFSGSGEYDDLVFYFRTTSTTDGHTIELGFSPVKLIMNGVEHTLSDVTITTIGNEINRIIDYIPEGVNPVLYKSEMGVLDNTNGVDWNLVYRNADPDEGEDVNPIQCFLYPSEGDISVYLPDTYIHTYSSFEANKYYLFAPFNNVSYVIKDNANKEYPVRMDGSTAVCVVLYRTGTTLKIQTCTYSNTMIVEGKLVLSNNSIRRLYTQVVITSIYVDAMEGGVYYKANSVPTTPTGITPSVQVVEPNGNIYNAVDEAEPLTPLSSIDRADPKLIKIISIPYFPSFIEFTANNITIDGTWAHNSSYNSCLELVDLNTRFVSEVITTTWSPFMNFHINVFSADISTNANRDDDDFYESKLFNSEFYQPKFVYDSFSFVFEMEKMINQNIWGERFSPRFTFEFVMTSTINSKFMFKFPEYELAMSTSDFDNVLPVSRNNEATIYNSAYITYLRTAYRYDLKKMEQERNMSLFGMGGKQVWGLIDGISQGYNENYIGMAKTIYESQLVNALSTMTKLNSLEWSMESRLESLKNQSASVSGSDDLDLMKNYCGNKAKLCIYVPSERMRKLVADLFYYYGYATDEMKVPSLDTRYWFNFIQCELELRDTGNNIPQEIITNLKQRFSGGITILHHHTTWNFDLDKENWEVSLLL